MTEHRLPASEIKEGDLIALAGEGTRKRVVERNERSPLNPTLREVWVRGAGTCHFKSTELVTVWRDWCLPR